MSGWENRKAQGDRGLDSVREKSPRRDTKTGERERKDGRKKLIRRRDGGKRKQRGGEGDQQ